MSQGNKAREAAFSLLIELVKKSPLLMDNFLKRVLMPMLDSVEKPKGWSFQPPSQEAGEGRVQEYVGLRNLGWIGGAKETRRVPSGVGLWLAEFNQMLQPQQASVEAVAKLQGEDEEEERDTEGEPPDAPTGAGRSR